jgi:hypothetical protein
MAGLDVQEVVKFLELANTAETQTRSNALEDLRFRYGDQWPAAISNSRKIESRPEFVINEVDGYCRQVVNSIRQQRPRGRADPVSGGADQAVAKVITGLGRHIEVSSDADNAYDTAVDFAVTMGFGYWRILTDYVGDNSFDQDIRVALIDNPFSVAFDPASVLPDGSDAKQALISTMISKEDFKREFPGAKVTSFTHRGLGETPASWETKEEIRLAEYYWIESRRAKLCLLSDGTTAWASEMPGPDILGALGLSVVRERDSLRKQVRWAKVTGSEVLDERDVPGRFIPVVPVYGVNVPIDGKRLRCGMVRFARDPQRLVNYWQTAITESVAMAPKAKWLMQDGQDEDYENEWRGANISAIPVLHYKGTNAAGQPAPAPQRLQPEPPPGGAIESAMLASQNLQRVLGMFDPVNVQHTGPKSGEAIRQEAGQSEQGNFHFYDNLTRSIKHTWRIFLDYMPVIYDAQRTMRIIGEDGKSSQTTINEVREGTTELRNPMNVGLYDVVMETGPGYNTKRQEAVGNLMQLLESPLGPRIAAVADDVIVRSMDFHGAQTVAERLAAANPLSSVDEQSDIPPHIQMVVKQLQANLQKLTQENEQLKTKQALETHNIAMRENAETAREHMRLAAQAHAAELKHSQATGDTHTRALTAQNVEEIRGIVQLLIHHLDASQLTEATP